MSDHCKDNGSSLEQKQQAARNASQANGNAEAAGMDKKLNGPNRPST